MGGYKYERHPNFTAPDFGGRAPTTRKELVGFALEYAARLVSAPKVEGEDVEIPCEEVAARLRRAGPEVERAIRRLESHRAGN